MVVPGLLAMLSLLVSWMGLGALFTGCGLLVFRAGRKRISSANDLLNLFWLGWGGTIFALIAWNFYYPVRGPFFGIFAGFGIIGCLLHFLEITQVLREWLANRRSELLVCAGLFTFLALLIANRALAEPLNPDMGLYYASSVRYAVEYPALPGIGNLHTRLAYNNSTFLYAAFLEAGLWTHRSQHVASGLPLLAMLARILWCGVRVLRPRDMQQAPALSTLFGLCFIPPWIALLVGRDLSCPGPDLCVYVLGFELCFKLIEYLEEAPRATPSFSGWPLFLIVFIAVLGVTHKLSFAVLGGLTCLLAIGTALKFSPASPWRGIGVVVLFAAVSGGMWAERGIILSGYPLYPNTSIDLQKDWAIPKFTGIQEVKSVLRSARDNKGDFETTSTFNNWSWLPGWLNKQISKNQRFYTVIPFVLAFGFGLAAFMAGLRKQTENWIWWAAAPMYGAIVFWFLTAPHPRFAGVILWAPCVLAFVLLLRNCGWHLNIASRANGFVAIIVFILITSVNIPIAYSPLFTEFKYDHGFAPLPEPAMRTFVTRSGLKLFKPVEGSQSFYAPLPCTPYPNEYVHLRKEGDITQGFAVDPEYLKMLRPAPPSQQAE